MLRILYRDDWLVAVDKPPGLLVHRTPLAQADDFVLQRLRRQLGRRVYTIHRLDRPTSGVLLFALTPALAVAVSRLFEERLVSKRYFAIARGYLDAEGLIDYPLRGEGGSAPRPAVTRYRTLARVELPAAVGRYPSSRYSLAEVRPLTGRYHQIRRHFHHIFHPLIGDTTHGDGRHNRYFRREMGSARLLLHAHSLSLTHPQTGDPLEIVAPLDAGWRRLLERLGWSSWVGGGADAACPGEALPRTDSSAKGPPP
jgi:tRNA pseudouridine65 synthase